MIILQFNFVTFLLVAYERLWLNVLSPPVSSVTASIDVVSGRLGTFRVRCTSSGGRALNMSVTGPGGFSEDLDNIQAVGTTQRMGSDRFSGSIDIIPPGGSDGQVYQCTASNGVPPDPTDTVELRGDCWMYMHTHMNTQSLLC